LILSSVSTTLRKGEGCRSIFSSPKSALPLFQNSRNGAGSLLLGLPLKLPKFEIQVGVIAPSCSLILEVRLSGGIHGGGLGVDTKFEADVLEKFTGRRTGEGEGECDGDG
jgi:hypothetical protein